MAFDKQMHIVPKKGLPIQVKVIVTQKLPGTKTGFTEKSKNKKSKNKNRIILTEK